VSRNVVVGWLTLRLRAIKDVSGPETGYPEVFRGFLSPAKRMPGLFLKITPRPLPSKPFPIYHPFITLSFDAIIILVTENA
jgi:hypothetical protein